VVLLIERGRGNGPLKPRQPPHRIRVTTSASGTVPRPSRAEIRPGRDEKEASL